jgi:hypothetical protein
MRTKRITVPVQAPVGSFGLRALETYVQECLRLYADKPVMSDAERSQLEQDRKTLTTTIVGNTLVTTIDKSLTYAEELADDLEQAVAGLRSLRDLYDENGQLKTGPDGKVPKDVLQKLRAVVWADYVRPQPGSGIEGTQGPAAGPATPNVNPTPEQLAVELERQQHETWMNFVQQSGFGWDLTNPDNLKILRKEAARLGIPWSKAGPWIGLAGE